MARVVCPVCNRRYHSGQVAILGYHGEDYLIKGICACGAIATFLITGLPPSNQPPISFEDVINAHQFLEAYTGGVDGLFSKDPPK